MAATTSETLASDAENEISDVSRAPTRQSSLTSISGDNANDVETRVSTAEIVTAVQPQEPIKVLAAISNWPCSPGTFRGWQSKVIEICSLLFSALIAMMLFVFALLSASVHNTYPGRSASYTSGNSVLVTNVSVIDGQDYDLLLGAHGNVDQIPVEIHHLNEKLLRVAKLSPTIVPILFAAIVGSCLRNFARWRAQQGSRLQTLELLVNSRSLYSTVSTIATLHVPAPLAIMLALLWSLSPLAGQASLRILDTTEIVDARFSVPWTVTNTGLTEIDQPTGMLMIDIELSWMTDLIYISQLNGNSFTKSNLTYGPSPLVPLERSNLEGLMSGASSPLNLSSFFSPVIICGVDWMLWDYGINRSMALCNGSMTYPITTHELDCPSRSNIQSIESPLTPETIPAALYPNNTNLASLLNTGSGLFIAIQPQQDVSNATGAKISFGSFKDSQLTTWHCSISNKVRDITVVCSTRPGVPLSGGHFVTCGFDSIGPSVESMVIPSNEYLLNLSQIWQAIDRTAAGTSSFSEKYLANGTVDTDFWLADLSQVDSITFSTRITALYNTLVMEVAQLNSMASMINSTSQTPLQILPFPIIKCNWIWFSITLLTPISLIACAILSAWLRCKINTPDILGFVSSLTIENPYVEIEGIKPGSGSGLDGLDRTRLLKDVRLRIGDVLQTEDIGKFALALEGDQVAVQEKGRKYM